MDYYRSEEGRYKRKVQNDKRRRPGKAPDQKAAHEAEELNAEVVSHVRMAASLIEGRRVSLREIIAMLRRVLKQRSLGGRRRFDYLVSRLNKAPP
jgi:hypothetical protein